jgi:hypothetical protein
MRIVALAAIAVVLCATSATADNLPDPGKSPGVALTNVLDDKSAQCLTDLLDQKVSRGDKVTKAMICTSGYTKCIRNVPASTKRKVFEEYGLQGNHTGYCKGNEGCEVDHLISLELGGSNDIKNLWPESYDQETWGAHVKDQLENDLHRMMCMGNMSLKDAQDGISGDWIQFYKKYHGQ